MGGWQGCVAGEGFYQPLPLYYVSSGSGEWSFCAATWGNPSAWMLAEYYSGGASFRGFSTLGALVGAERPSSRVLIAVADSLASEARCGPGDYASLSECVKSYVERYLCGVDAEVVVLPGVLEARRGERGYKFTANLEDFRLLFMYHLYFSALRAAGGGRGRIALDISHGVNYMPTLTFDAAQEAAAMLAAALAAPVRLRVYQADPYPQLGESASGLRRSPGNPCDAANPSATPPVVNYNVAREVTVNPWDLVRFTAYRQANARRLLTRSEGFELRAEQVERICGKALQVLGAFRIGALPELAVLAKTTDLKDLEQAIESTVRYWSMARRAREAGDTIVVESATRLSDCFRALLNAHAVVRGVARLLSAGGCPGLEDCSVSFTELKNLRQLLRGSRVVAKLIERELSKLKHASGRMTGSWTLYALILNQQPRQYTPDVFERDFIAHAGFHADVLNVKTGEGGVEVRVEPSKWGEVEKVLQEAVTVSS